jgi:UPF0042 nucleotide-binding protein
VEKPALFIITGLSGSGKSTAMTAFEDAGYYCVDNMPVKLLPVLLETPPVTDETPAGVTCVMDIREKGFLSHYKDVFQMLRRTGQPFQLLFFEADEPVLIQRYSQTRRQHPLAMGKGLVESIRIEKQQLEPLRKEADQLIDTTRMNVHELKAMVRGIADRGKSSKTMRILLMSFGFKYGIPLNSDLVMDVRFLPNPFFVPELKALDGRDRTLQRYVFQEAESTEFLERYGAFLVRLIPLYEREGKSYLTISIGCTGGRHRSVAVCEELYERLRSAFPAMTIDIMHRDIEQEV